MSTEKYGTSRQEEARKTAEELLRALEAGSLNSEQLLMKAQRVARLLRDTDAQQWLDFELTGYPDDFTTSALGSAAEYAKRGRLYKGGWHRGSLPALEIELDVRKQELSKLTPSPTMPVGDIARMLEDRSFSLAVELPVWQRLFSGVKAALHAYATDVHISLAFGERVQSLFEGARASTERFIARYCPKAVEQLLSVAERLQQGDEESCSQALTTCRRILLTVADAVFPAREEPYSEASGKPRTVGPKEYKNRLLAFITERLKGKSDVTLLESELEHLAARLDAVYDRACKGVHESVTIEEARLAVIHSYLFIAEVAGAESIEAEPRGAAPEEES